MLPLPLARGDDAPQPLGHIKRKDVPKDAMTLIETLISRREASNCLRPGIAIQIPTRRPSTNEIFTILINKAFLSDPMSKSVFSEWRISFISIACVYFD